MCSTVLHGVEQECKRNVESGHDARSKRQAMPVMAVVLVQQGQGQEQRQERSARETWEGRRQGVP